MSSEDKFALADSISRPLRSKSVYHSLSSAMAGRDTKRVFLLRKMQDAVLRALPRHIVTLLDRTLSDGNGLEALIGVPYIGAISNHPAPDAQALVAVASDADRNFADSLQALHCVMRADHVERSRVIAVTSALPGEGKTTSTLALARSAALSGVRTLLIDFDIRRASINSYLPVAPTAGLLEVLRSDVDFTTAVLVERSTTLSILPLKIPCGTLENIFITQNIAALLLSLRKEFDMIFLDCAPVLVIADTRNAACLADFVILVARWRKTPLRAVRLSVGMLRDAGAKVRGLVLTRKSTR